MALISPSRRLRRTPFSEGVEAAGVKAYTIYNRMLLPTVFDSVEADYHHLKQHVQVWDVAYDRPRRLCTGDVRVETKDGERAATVQATFWN